VAATSQPTYHFLVHNNNASMWMRNFWNNHFDQLWKDTSIDSHSQVQGQIYWMFHLKTNNLDIDHVKTLNTRPFVSIHSMHFVFPFCPIEAGYIVIPIFKQNWETHAKHFSEFSSFLPLRVGCYLSPLQSFFKIKFTLRNLLKNFKSPLLDRGMAEFIFPNTSFIKEDDKTCFCCNLNLVYNETLGNTERFERLVMSKTNEKPLLTINEQVVEILLTTLKDVYTFLSCGDTYYDTPDFLALFMPFSKTTWALIAITIFGWPLVLSIIENDFNLRNVLQDFDALFIGWAMILEQSHLRATNYKGRGSLYCYCGCVLLAILVLSNAYKGDNIRTLTKSFELVPLTQVSQLNKVGYHKYSRVFCFPTLSSFTYLPGMIINDLMTKKECMINEFEYEKGMNRHQYTDYQLES